MEQSKARAITIHGPSFYLVKQALDNLIAELETGPKDFDFSELDATESDAAQVMGSVTTSPFFGQKRTVVVRRADSFSEDEGNRLIELAGSLPDFSRLVLVFENEDVTAKSKKIIDAIKKIGLEIKCVIPSSDKLAEELVAMAKKESVILERPAAKLLCELVSDDPSDATNELQKLCFICAESGRIQAGDVQKYTTSSREHKVFALIDAVCSANLTTAMRQLDLLFASAKDIGGYAMQNVLPLIHRQLRLIFQAKAIASERVGMESERAKEICTQTYGYLALWKKGGFALEKINSSAKRLTWDQIRELFCALERTDKRLKGQLPAVSHRESIERMVLEMCEAVRNSGRVFA